MKNKNLKTWMGWIITLLLFLIIMVIVISIKGWNKEGFVFFFKKILIDNFLGINALLLGFITFTGYVILGRGFVSAIVGSIKTMIGVLYLSIGAGMLVGMAKPIFNGLRNISSSNIVPLDPYFGWTSSNTFLEKGISIVGNYVSWVSFALIVGLVVNVILVALKKYTNIHSIMITGHIMFQQTAIMTAVIYLFLFRNISGVLPGGSSDVNGGTQVGIILFTGIIMGVYWGVASTSSIRGTQKVTNNAGFALGHQQIFGAAIAYKIGKYFGKAKDSAETRKFSKRFRIFEDNIFTQSLIIFILFTILIIILKTSTSGGWDPAMKGSPYASWKVAGGAYWIMNMFLGSFKIVTSILVLTAGVRMFVTELQQAFQGIALKILPGSMVAVDCAATYGFSPNSVTYGFVSGVIAQFIAVGIIIGISIGTNGKLPMVIPLFITLFFNSGTIGVFANASGGWKASIIVPAIFGFVELFMAAGALAVMQNSYDTAVNAKEVVEGASLVKTGYIGMADWNLIWSGQFMIAGSSIFMGWITFIVSILTMLIMAQYIDNGMQSKKTYIQRIFRKKMKLIKEQN